MHTGPFEFCPISLNKIVSNLKWTCILKLPKVYHYYLQQTGGGPKLGKDKRSNSCVSEGSVSSGGNAAASLFPSGAASTTSNSRRPSRAFLIKQRDSGEETLVTLTPVTSPPLRPQLPTITRSKGSMSSIESHSGNNDCLASAEALEAARIEKMVRSMRRQATDEETRYDEERPEEFMSARGLKSHSDPFFSPFCFTFFSFPLLYRNTLLTSYLVSL